MSIMRKLLPCTSGKIFYNASASGIGFIFSVKQPNESKRKPKVEIFMSRGIHYLEQLLYTNGTKLVQSSTKHNKLTSCILNVVIPVLFVHNNLFYI